MLQSGGFICRNCRAQLLKEWRDIPILATPGFPKYMSNVSSTPLKLAPEGLADDILGDLGNREGVRSKYSGLVFQKVIERPVRRHSLLPKARNVTTEQQLFNFTDGLPRAPISSAGNDEPNDGRSEQSHHQWPSRESQESLAQERGFNAANYSPDDQDFWAKYDEIWAGLVQEDSIPDILPGQFTSMVNLDEGKAQSQGADMAEVRFDKKKEKRSTDQMSWLLTHSSPEAHTAEKKRFRAWKKGCSRAWRRLQARLPPPERITVTELKRLLAREDVVAMAEAWRELKATRERRVVIWAHVMAEALRCAPDKARLVLRATFEEDMAPFYAVEDTVSFLVQQLVSMGPGEGEAARKEVCDTILHVLKNSSKRYVQLRQSQLAAVLKGLDAEKIAELLMVLRNYEHPLHRNTLLQFAGLLAKHAKHKPLSYDLLRSLLQKGDVDINSPHFAALCTAILSLKEGDAVDELHTTPAELFQDLLNLGLRPNLITYTAIIRNLCLCREFDKAREIFGIMLERGIEPDAHLYSVLLNGAKLAGDLASVGQYVTAALSKGIRDPVILNDLLQTVFLEYMNEARRKTAKPPRLIPAFRPMLEVYSKFFQLEPLQKLVLPDLDELLRVESGLSEDWSRWDSFGKIRELVADLPAWKPEERLEPRGDTLATMLTGYVKGFSDAYSTLAFYARFRNLLGSGDAVAAGLVRDRGTLVHDLVIKAVTEWNGMLRVALDVVSDMLRDATAVSSSPQAAPRSDEAAAMDRHQPQQHRHPPPSVHTWSVLLHGLLHHRQHRQAERVLRMMRERGAEPTLVTWNTLVAGYAREQNVAGTVAALQRLERAGLTADDWTVRAFSYLRDQQRALRAMEAVVERRRRGMEMQEETLGVEDAGEDMWLRREMIAEVREDGGDREDEVEVQAEKSVLRRGDTLLLPLTDKHALHELGEQVNEMTKEVGKEDDSAHSAQDWDDTGWWKE